MYQEVFTLDYKEIYLYNLIYYVFPNKSSLFTNTCLSCLVSENIFNYSSKNIQSWTWHWNSKLKSDSLHVNHSKQRNMLHLSKRISQKFVTPLVFLYANIYFTITSINVNKGIQVCVEDFWVQTAMNTATCPRYCTSCVCP